MTTADTNGQGTPSSSSPSLTPLKVNIAGAGIGGLCAAIGLRRQGHHVAVYEQSRMAQETGAAIHVAPNCNGLLKRLGLDTRQHGSVEMLGLTQYFPSGDLKFSMDSRPINKMWQHSWELIHRAHLHSALKELAVSTEGKGRPVELWLSTGVESVDPLAATLTLTNGTHVHGDLAIGADGVHSKTRKAIPGGDLVPFDSGKTAYRFLIPTDTIASNPLTAPLLQPLHHLLMWIAEDRRVVMYPCVKGTQMNFVAMFPSEESAKDTTGDSWQLGGSKERMLSIFSEFGESVRTLLSFVDESKLKTWTLLDMNKMPTFIHHKFAVIGDAAHPFLPHQAQGGAQAIEDAMSLAAFLPLGTRPDEIESRLHLYQTQRYERSHHIQQGTRDSGADLSKGQQLDMQSFTAYNVAHDEWHSSTAALDKHLLSQQPHTRWRMPTGFGPAPGPRQPLGFSPDSHHIRSLRQTTPETSSTYSIRFRSSRTYLQRLLPPGFSYPSPATVCEVTLSCRTLSGMTWLGGGGYNLVMLELHGVQYIKQNGERLSGSYIPLLFENLADPIITGREELGMPKMFSDIAITSTETSAEVVMSWRGTEFGRMSFNNFTDPAATNGVHTNGDTAPPKGPPRRPTPPDMGQFTYRYVPAVGEPGKADAEYAVLLPKPSNPTIDPEMQVLETAEASFKFDAGDWTTLPTLHNITRVLAEMPKYGVVKAGWVRGKGVGDLGEARRVE